MTFTTVLLYLMTLSNVWDNFLGVVFSVVLTVVIHIFSILLELLVLQREKKQI